jgi:hypothetical protein
VVRVKRRLADRQGALMQRACVGESVERAQNQGKIVKAAGGLRVI